MKTVYKVTAIQLCCSSAIESVWEIEQKSLETGPRIHQTLKYIKVGLQLALNECSNSGVSKLLPIGQI